MWSGGRNGGYDDGYRLCPCLWGDKPGSLVSRVFGNDRPLSLKVLDLGCGEGKNAAYFSRRGATVDAVDCSDHALRNAESRWGPLQGVTWHLEDAATFVGKLECNYDVVVMYGLLHCLSTPVDALSLISRCRELTNRGGLHIVCAFNRRSQDLSAHPNFEPLLLDHGTYVHAYDGWHVEASDEDLFETHPHNGIPHHHSLTRLIARAPA